MDTDIRILSVEPFFTRETARTPLKFGGVVMDDRGKVTGVPSGCACGDGVIDWPRVIKILRKAKFKGVLSVECSNEEQGLRSIKYLRKVLRAK